MEDIKDLRDSSVFWEYFYQISKIPRCSGKEEMIRNFIKNEAEKLGFQTDGDQVNNLVVRIPSTDKTGHRPSRVVLQSHMDMVCEKNENTVHDFSKDPLKLKIVQVENEKWLTAEGTTLGADNGVGVAYQLTLMKKFHDSTLDFGSLEVDLLFTVDEERGLTGASQLGKDLIKGLYLINLDSEEDDRFTVGCAGGKVFTAKIPTEKISLEKDDQFVPVKITVKGLIGGHSGTDIIKGRGNALKIITEILWKVNNKFTIFMNSIEGGNLTNAIPRESDVVIYLKKDEFPKIKRFIEEFIPDIRNLYEGIEPNIDIRIDDLEDFNDSNVFTEDFQSTLLDVLFLMPSGPLSFHPKNKELVHTSTNFATIHTEHDLIQIRISQRSLTQYDKDVAHEKVKTLLNMFGPDLTIIIDSEYPSWPPDFNSKIVTLSKEVYKELFNKEVTIQAIHAGLECAYFRNYFPQMQMISIGPNVEGGHSPDERLSINSVEIIWRFLLKLLKKLS